uniref:Uncharacterized protein n=1 Tax=viral metagenome TaxID=1070528 RepID=A0A6M3JR99_9ZZZZ
MKCEVFKCERVANKYALNVPTKHGKTWLQCCTIHDNYFGLKNLEASGYTRQEARQVEKELRDTDED